MPVPGKSSAEDSEYADSPWLTLLVNFSGVVLVIGGVLALIVLAGNVQRGVAGWLPDLAVVLVLMGWHVGMRLLRRHRRSTRP